MFYEQEQNELNQQGNSWDLLDKYSADFDDYSANTYWDESFLHEDELIQSFTTNVLEPSCFKPHRNPLKDNHEDIKAKYLKDTKGNCLLYPGLITLLYGKPGTWKSWIALSLVGVQNIRYWDFENFGPIMATRLRLMGVSPDDAEVFDYPNSRAEIMARVQEYIVTKPEILVIDGMSGLARTCGVNTDANDQVERLFNEVLIPLKKVGIAVLLLDHLPKDSPVDDFPIGAQAKKSQCDVSILIRNRKDLDEADIFITKDRNFDLFSRCGQGPTPKLYGWLNKPSTENDFRAMIEPDLVAFIDEEEIDSFTANLYREVCNFVQKNPESSGTKIEENVQGKNSRIRSAIVWLVTRGFLIQTKKGNASHYRVNKPLDQAIAWRSRGDYFA
jgi:hypothetical protein